MPIELARITVRDAREMVDIASGAKVFHVADSHALVQASGYLKYGLGSSSGRAVYFRGQTSMYASLSPSLFRDIKNRGAQDARIAAVNDVIEEARTAINLLGKLPLPVVEPLLQHYGLNTSWIDLVDNIWVALWFACYRARATGNMGRYLHFERRLPRNESEKERFAYILLIATDFIGAETKIPGIWRRSSTELVDLRIAAPSIFLRPHAQHGLLFRAKGGLERRDVDYSAAIAGVIRVSLEDALDWLGEGKLLGVHTLFPPPTYDHGYRILLQEWPKLKLWDHPLVGTIGHIGA
jgi:hypothetical protein